MGRYLSPTQWLRWTLSYPIEEQGHSPSQWVLWTLSYPVHETDRRARLPIGQSHRADLARSTGLAT